MNYFERQIKRFLDKTKEVVFLNIHRFNPENERSTKDSSGHQRLKTQLNNVFKDNMIPFSDPKYGKTFRECWSENKRLFLSYDHPSYTQDKTLWPGMKVCKRYVDLKNTNDLGFIG